MFNSPSIKNSTHNLFLLLVGQPLVTVLTGAQIMSTNKEPMLFKMTLYLL